MISTSRPQQSLTGCHRSQSSNEVGPLTALSWGEYSAINMSAPTTPYREIRAHHINDTITLYQAYSPEIGTTAVEHQRLDTSPEFSTTRMTCIKPSWACMRLLLQGSRIRVHPRIIGVPDALVNDLVKGVFAIEDVTERARELNRELDETKDVDLEDLQSRGLVLKKKTFVINKDLRHLLHIAEQESA
ncbi:hypothetical protein BU25DRAFT_416908 [Macroventuria anomochaeta]|uniref:Uncharacterized protein n=1 Tax=Macroventuria anomochaeta TaxID=301207 RepID=A0ACB6SJM5_9PLEO|nr:uncharacterized protein BU25DRAFT_416908 [Macroventuria anomochaeta]KAF2633743.1 hypothetical protein BU25DRAFT_416908 [Macroventuria anomochaeta]